MRSVDNGQGLCTAKRWKKRREGRVGRRGAQRLNNGTSWKRGVMPAGKSGGKGGVQKEKTKSGMNS